MPEPGCPVVFRDSEMPLMVATLRSAYGRHVGEPAWEDYIRGLSAASPRFAELWAGGDVLPPGPRVKTFRHEAVGELRMTSVSLSVDGMPECRIVAYTPDDEKARKGLAVLRERRERLWPPSPWPPRHPWGRSRPCHRQPGDMKKSRPSKGTGFSSLICADL